MRKINTCCLALTLLATPAWAQLRPLPPLDWRTFESSAPVLAEVGFGLLRDQHASLAGTRGTLYELGNFNLAWRTGRVVLELSGTANRQFHDEVVVRPPSLGAKNAPNGGLRHDAGDVRASTIIRVLGGTGPASAALRFGTRLPTTSEEIGLDRDRTDFFATFGARYRIGRLGLSAESGVAINGTRVDSSDQSDAWAYSCALDFDAAGITSTLIVVGHQDGHASDVRGNEDLSEIRFGLRTGDRFWVQVVAVQGIETFSPSHGLLLTAGMQR